MTGSIFVSSGTKPVGGDFAKSVFVFVATLVVVSALEPSILAADNVKSSADADQSGPLPDWWANRNSEDRWKAVREVAKELGIRMRAELIVQLQGEDATPQLGYPFAVELLARKRPFTALFAYNDISAIGSILAFQEAGLRIPEDISVVGFDDIAIAVHNNPSLTTVRQPLVMMGEMAARALLNRLEDPDDWVAEIKIKPDLVVRNSTARAVSLPAGPRDRSVESLTSEWKGSEEGKISQP